VSYTVDSPDGDPDFEEWQNLRRLTFDQRVDDGQKVKAFNERRAEADRPFQELVSDLAREFLPKVTVAASDEDSPEARESRRAAAGRWQVDTVTRTVVDPNGHIEWDG